MGTEPFKQRELSIIVPEHVAPAQVEDNLAPKLVEPSVAAVVPFDHFSMGSIAKGSIGTEFAIAHLVVATLANIEVHGSVSGSCIVAHRIAPRPVLTNSAGAVPVDLE